VIALRLYTGPGYQPVNSWLRNVGKLDTQMRTLIAKSTEFTYAATVRHITDAIRKLAKVGHPELENAPMLYRGLKGKLNEHFWRPDEQGIICATDLGFMSTSLNMETPMHYLQTGVSNLMWEIQHGGEDAAGYHTGVLVSMISQFEKEKEVLFPPLTMLRVIERPSEHPPRELEGSQITTPSAELENKWASYDVVHNEKSFKLVTVIPSFV